MANYRKQVLLAKLETTYGTNAAPTGAANAMLTSPVSLVPLTADYKEREIVQGFFGNRQQLATVKAATATFMVELAGSGAAGTAPKYGPLLQACGFGATVTSPSVVYKPITDSIPSVTIEFYLDGLKHRLTGARGSFTTTLTTNEIPKIEFTFTGLYNTVTDAALPSATTTAFQSPLIVGSTNTTGFTIDGYGGVLQELSLDVANAVINYQMIGKEEIRITDRAPTGGIKLEAPSVADKNFVTLAANNTLGALAIQHGQTAGKIITFAAPKVQLTNPTYEEQENVVLISTDLSLVPNTGNDELVITFK